MSGYKKTQKDFSCLKFIYLHLFAQDNWIVNNSANLEIKIDVKNLELHLHRFWSEKVNSITLKISCGDH